MHGEGTVTEAEEDKHANDGLASCICLVVMYGGIYSGATAIAGDGWGCLAVGIATLLLMLFRRE